MTSAINKGLPEWQARLAAATGRPVQIIINFDALLSTADNSQGRLTAAHHLIGNNEKHRNCVLEHMVEAFELSTKEPAVKNDIAAKIDRVEFVNLPKGTPMRERRMELHNGALVVFMILSGGSSGVPHLQQFKEFFEQQFYAEERYLVTRFVHESLPTSVARISAAIGHPIKFEFDIIGEISKAQTQGERLPAAQTLVSISGTERNMVAASRQLDEAVTAIVRATEKTLTGTARPKPGKQSIDVFHSPNFLKPLVFAIEKIMSYDPIVAQTIAQCISTIHVENLPGKDRKQKLLGLAAAPTAPLLQPTPNGMPPMANGVLVYKMVLNAGSGGLFNEKEIEEFFEEHFKCHEKAMVNQLIAAHAPAAQEALSGLFHRPFPIEFVWGSIFADNLTTKERLVTAEALTQKNSEHVLTVIVKSFQEVLATENARAAIMPVITKIAIQATPGTASNLKPGLYLAPAGPTGGQVLVYAPVLARGARGCLSELDFKTHLRQLFQLPVPSSDRGLNGSYQRMANEVNKIGMQFFGSRLM